MTVGRVVFLPPSGDNIIEAGKGMPATIIQPQGTVQYVHYKGQQSGSPNIPSQQVGPLQKLLRVEMKTFGAVQIIIGLMHIGFGALPFYLFQSNYQPLAAVRSYPFWGGLSFIFSGSLSVAVEKHLKPFLVKCSVITNILSAILALAGIILCILELHFNQQTHHEINQKYLLYYFNPKVFNLWSVGAGLCVLFLLFSLLEFFIAVFTAYFGCRAACCNYDMTTTLTPYSNTGGGEIPEQGRLVTAAEPVKMVNGTMVIIAPNDANTIQAGERIPSTMMHYIQDGGHQYESLNGQPQQKPCVGALKKFIKLEAKTLGALQIMIGLLHIGFGIVSVILVIGYAPIALGSMIYPMYSGLSFIASGSVSVSAEKHWNTSLTNTSVGMNIMSALLASIGIVMYICEMVLRLVILNYHETSATLISGSVAFSALFLLFTSLEFCITVTVAHFGCRANCCTDDTAIIYVPYTVSGENIVPAEDNLASQTAV